MRLPQAPAANQPAPQPTPGSRSILRSTKLLVALVAVVALAVVGTTVGYMNLGKDVTLSVDGERTQVTALGSTVADVLAEEGIEVTERDEVAPALDAPLQDGMAVSVRYGRPLELTVDGKTRTHWVMATDVSSALDDLGRRFRGADLSVSRSAHIRREGLELEVVTPKQVTVAVGGKKARSHAVPALTVRDVLDQLDVTVGDDDEVTPRLRKEIAGGERITVTRVRVETRKVTGEEIDFETVERDDDSKPEGDETVVGEGRTGLRDVTYRLRFENGELVARTVVDQQVTRKPVQRVVRVGTQTAPTENFVAGNSVWDRLAQCESGGNWAINTGNGYYGGLQFSAATWRSVGGTGLPHQHSREEQIKRGQILQSRAGWGQWPHCTSRLGLR